MLCLVACQQRMLIKVNYYIHNKDLENGLTQSVNRIIYELIMSCGGVQVCEINQRRFLATFQSTNGSGSAVLYNFFKKKQFIQIYVPRHVLLVLFSQFILACRVLLFLWHPKLPWIHHSPKSALPKMSQQENKTILYLPVKTKVHKKTGLKTRSKR